MGRLVLALSFASACAATSGTREELASEDTSEPPPQIRPQAPKVPQDRPAPQRARLPEWVDARLDSAAVSLVGADADSIDILVGQFEHPQEAIIRFDRDSGCASEVIGPWPTISTIVRGREMSTRSGRAATSSTWRRR